MSVTANDYLVSAKAMLDGTSEVDYRNAASRAYYAAYHQGKEVEHLCPDVRVENVGVHTQLITKFEKYISPLAGWTQARNIGYTLKKMKLTRAQADYELGTDFPLTEAQLQIQMAEKLSTKVLEFIQVVKS